MSTAIRIKPTKVPRRIARPHGCDRALLPKTLMTVDNLWGPIVGMARSKAIKTKGMSKATAIAEFREAITVTRVGTWNDSNANQTIRPITTDAKALRTIRHPERELASERCEKPAASITRGTTR